MMLFYFSYPVLLLVAACTGYGMLTMGLLRRRFVGLPIVFRFTVAYFLGQSLLVAVFVFLALNAVFAFAVVIRVIVPGAIFCVLAFWLYRHDIGSAFAKSASAWLQAPWSWRLLTLLAAALVLCGPLTMARILEGDATAFYFAAAKLIAYSGRIGTLPGYENFSWTVMTGEIAYASLMLLGSPGTSARFYDWINFLPVLAAFYYVARLCDLSTRAAFLGTLMTLTSSTAIGLLGGGKVDSFAIGPALIGVWFALASWRSDRRQTYVAMSGLFCGFAIVAKVSYLIVILPSAMLLIYWHDINAMFSEMKTLAWNRLFQRVMRMARLSPWFFGFLVLALAPFIIKNQILFHGPIGETGTSVPWFSRQTALRIILSYPIALTYGRYWAQMGTMSPLVLAFAPLFFLLPRSARSLAKPLAAITVATLVAIAIWIALEPSIFMPRYILATLLLLGIPAAAGAAHVSRGRTVLAGIVVSAAATVIILTPYNVSSRWPTFYPDEAIAYFGDGKEEKLFNRDLPFIATNAVNEIAKPGERVLLLMNPRLWLRGDLLVAMTRMPAEMLEAATLFDQRSDRFWSYVQENKFGFFIVDASRMDNAYALLKIKPTALEVCEIKNQGSVAVFQIREGCAICPPGNRTVLEGPFPRVWPDGNIFRAELPALESMADSAASPWRSPLVLCEGDKRFWRPHSMVSEIRTEGGGRFSHWGQQLFFSTSDNSDPNVSGRKYEVVVP